MGLRAYSMTPGATRLSRLVGCARAAGWGRCLVMAAHSPRVYVRVWPGRIAFYTVLDMLCQEGGQLPGCVQTGYAIRAFSRRAGWCL